MSFHDFMHWFWAAVFFGLGILFIVLRDRIGNVRALERVTRVDAGFQAGEWHERISAAIARREEAEGKATRIGWWAGSASLALGFLAVFSALPDGLLYALLCLSMAAACGGAFLGLRNTQRKRVAVLTARSPGEVIPWYWFALALVGPPFLLSFAGTPWFVSALLVCLSSLMTTGIAWRLTQLGSILTGEDVQAEQLVDDRLRMYRSCMVLVLSYLQPFVFVSQILDRNGAQTVAYFVSWAGFMGFTLWQLKWQRRGVQLTR